MIIDFLELINTCTQILYEIIMEKKEKGNNSNNSAFIFLTSRMMFPESTNN